MFDGMTSAQLAEILAAVEPVELKGVALLKRRRPKAGQWFPDGVGTRVLSEAAIELMGYHAKCANFMARLVTLTPVPSSAPVEEWPL